MGEWGIQRAVRITFALPELLNAPPDQFVERMIVQRGIYTLHSFERDALERLAVADRAQHDGACFCTR